MALYGCLYSLHTTVAIRVGTVYVRTVYVGTVYVGTVYASALAESVLNCRLWKNGIRWCDQNNIVTVVELVDADQCVLVLMSCEENARKLIVSLRRELIKDIETSFKEYCTGVKAGFVIDPDCLEYPIDKPIERTVYSVENLKGKDKDIYVQPMQMCSYYF